MGTQASQTIPNFLELAWLACDPINFDPKNMPKILLIFIPFFTASLDGPGYTQVQVYLVLLIVKLVGVLIWHPHVLA